MHAIVDDHSPARLRRAAPRRERSDRDARFVERALAFFAAHGIEPPEAADDRQRLRLPPQPLASASCSPTAASATCRTPPYRPRTNGKVERFHQTLASEWAYGLTYRQLDHRARSPATLAPATTTAGRPHSSLGDRPPISRVHNVRGQDI